MWMIQHDNHLTDEQLMGRYFAEDGGVAPDRSHVVRCETCARRYAALTRDLELLADTASDEADVVLTPELLAHQRNQIVRRLESHRRRADIFVFPTFRNRTGPSRTAFRRPARWVAAAAAAGLAVGLGLGFGVERFRVNYFQELSSPIASRAEFRTPAGARWQAEPRFEGVEADAIVGPVGNDDELLEEIDAALVTRRAQELRALDALTPENVNISLRRR